MNTAERHGLLERRREQNIWRDDDFGDMLNLSEALKKQAGIRGAADTVPRKRPSATRVWSEADLSGIAATQAHSHRSTHSPRRYCTGLKLSQHQPRRTDLLHIVFDVFGRKHCVSSRRDHDAVLPQR